MKKIFYLSAFILTLTGSTLFGSTLDGLTKHTIKHTMEYSTEIKHNDFKDAKSSKATQPQEILTGILSIAFEKIATAETPTEKSKLLHSEKVTINGKEQRIGFTSIMVTGYADNGEIFGLVKDQNDQAIKFEDGSNYICNGTNGAQGSGLDFSSILQKNNKLYMVNQFECNVGAMYMFELKQDKITGALSPKKNTLQYISQKSEFGGYVHCAGQATPWNSHLGSEEYTSC